VIQAGNQRITNKEQSPRVAELRQELRRKIAAHTLNAGAHATAIRSLTCTTELHQVLAIPQRLSPASPSSFKGESA
jgi:hypothetical protein